MKCVCNIVGSTLANKTKNHPYIPQLELIYLLTMTKRFCFTPFHVQMSWAQPCSLTAVKYQRYGVVESKPFLAGERLSVAREMERNVKGFKEVRRELALARRMVEEQETMRKDSTVDKVIQTSFYKSVVGTRLVI